MELSPLGSGTPSRGTDVVRQALLRRSRQAFAAMAKSQVETDALPSYCSQREIRFLSVEPLLGPIEALPLGGIHWVVVGGESGPRCRPMDPAWVRSIRRQCAEQSVPFFFKQWGGTQKKRAGRLLDGREWNEMPVQRERVSSTSLDA